MLILRPFPKIVRRHLRQPLLLRALEDRRVEVGRNHLRKYGNNIELVHSVVKREPAYASASARSLISRPRTTRAKLREYRDDIETLHIDSVYFNFVQYQ